MESQPTNYASFGQRFLAYLIDIIILMVIFWIIFSVFGISMMGDYASMDPETMSSEEAAEVLSKGLGGMMMANLLSTVISILYFAYFESSAKQGTFGKQALGIQVTDMDGNRISFGKAILRNIGRIISGMILLIGYIMAAFTSKKQALHDLIASTLVLKP
jgi:uncharacterized RDD family membrane protein YckC